MDPAEKMRALGSSGLLNDPAAEALPPLPVGRSRATAAPGGRALRHRWWRDALRRRLLAGADVAAILFAGAAVSVPATGSLWPLVFAPLWIVAAKLFGLYDRDHRALRHLTADEIPMLIAWAGTVAALLALLLPLTPAGSLGGLSAVKHVVALFLMALLLRSVARWIWWKRTPPEMVGMIGEEADLASMKRKFGLFRDMHFELGVAREVGEMGTGATRLRRLRALADRVDRVVLAPTTVDTDLIEELTAICRERQVKLSIVSPLRGRTLPSAHIAQLADLPIFEYGTWDPSRSTLMIKRAFDVSVALAGLVLFAPVLAVIAAAIKLDTRGPVFFSQIRAGIHGRPFRMYKLRTMQTDAEARLEEVVDLDALAEPAFKIRRDPRVTRVGAVLRRFSLDEVPQLFNVLLGEMSVVGPRPEQVELVERYTAEDRARLAVKPGITGPMQILGRGDLTFPERLAVELEYVQDPSLSRDLRIILHTLPTVVRGTGAY